MHLTCNSSSHRSLTSQTKYLVKEVNLPWTVLGIRTKGATRIVQLRLLILKTRYKVELRIYKRKSLRKSIGILTILKSNTIMFKINSSVVDIIWNNYSETTVVSWWTSLIKRIKLWRKNWKNYGRVLFWTSWISKWKTNNS